METNQSDGQGSGQSGSTGEGNFNVDGGGEHRDPDSGRYVSKEEFQNLNAKIDMLTESFTEVRGSLSQRNAPAHEEVEEDFDDDEPLTASKVAKIVKRQTERATAHQSAVSERREWDRKAANEFPLQDPKFQLEFKRQWKEASNAGMDVNHPRSLYHVARQTAQLVSASSQSRPKQNNSNEEFHDSEAPNSGRGGQSSRNSKSVGDGDPRVTFYRMKGNKTEAQVAKFKEKLVAQDEKKRKGTDDE